MDAVKEIVMQVLIAGLPAFLFPLIYRKGSKPGLLSPRQDPETTRSIMLAVLCAASVLFCALFSRPYHDVIPMEFGSLPLFTLLLYGRLRTGLAVAVFRVALFPMYAVNHNLTGLLLESGLALYPFILMLSRRFKSMQRHDKAVVLFLWFAAGQMAAVVSPCCPAAFNSLVFPTSFLLSSFIWLPQPSCAACITITWRTQWRWSSCGARWRS